MEYPGYGIYQGTPNSEQIKEDALIVYDFLHYRVGYQGKNIIIMGRSIGSGPSTYLATNRKAGLLTLISPFTSIKRMVNEFGGSLATNFIKNHFDNLGIINQVKSPLLLIHGKRDKLISYEHSRDIFEKFQGMTELFLA